MKRETLEALMPVAERLRTQCTALADCYEADAEPALAAGLRQMRVHAAEVGSRAFVVIVVGPVKSGKSTFVNLLAHEHVSPTDYLECTVRPSVIARRAEGQPSMVRVFRSAETGGAGAEGQTVSLHATGGPMRSGAETDGPVAQPMAQLGQGTADDGAEAMVRRVEAVIDHLKGIDATGLEGIVEEAHPLTAEALARYVKLPAHLRQVAVDDGTLLTSITAQGGRFLADDVYLIDMPGFDGLVAGLHDSPEYAAITRRADLVVFIQSSNSAIGRIQQEFFDVLRAGNGHVPVCLVHNVYDSGYWRSAEVRQRAIDAQMEQAKATIRGAGFRLSDTCCFVVDLGKATDAQSGAGADVLPQYADIVARAGLDFDRIETALSQQITSSKNMLRLVACLHRMETDVASLMAHARTLAGALGSQLDQTQQTLHTLEQGATDTCHIPSNELTAAAVDWDTLYRQLEAMPQRYVYDTLVAGRRYTTAEARALVGDLIGHMQDLVGRYVGSAYRPDDVQRAVDSMSLRREREIAEVIYPLLGPQPGPQVPQPQPETVTPHVESLSEAYPVEAHIGRKLFGRHSIEEVKTYVRQAFMAAVGMKVEGADPYTGGALWRTVRPQFERDVRETVEQMVGERRAAYAAWYDDLCRQVVATLPDVGRLRAQIDRLTALVGDLSRLHFPRL